MSGPSVLSDSIQDPAVVFDESGNTGGNLLDHSQPVFVLASILETANLLREIRTLGTPPNGEFHFSKLRRSGPGRRTILRILNFESMERENVHVAIFHKPWAAVGKLVDLLIEPSYFHSGQDFYQGRRHIRYQGLLYAGLPEILGPDKFNAFLSSFIRMVRGQLDEDLALFLSLALEAREAARDVALLKVLGELPAEIDRLRSLLPGTDGKRSDDDLDPAMTCLVQQCGSWSKQLPRFKVRHDDSKSVRLWQGIIERMMDPEAPKHSWEVGGTLITHPTNATGIEFVNSAEVPSVQMADVVAGAAAALARGALDPYSQDDFWRQTQRTRLPKLIDYTSWPET